LVGLAIARVSIAVNTPMVVRDPDNNGPYVSLCSKAEDVHDTLFGRRARVRRENEEVVPVRAVRFTPNVRSNDGLAGGVRREQKCAPWKIASNPVSFGF
jgi:hypothetical protein